MHLGIFMPYLGKGKQVTIATFLVKEQMYLSFPLMSLEYHDVLYDIFLSWMSVYA